MDYRCKRVLVSCSLHLIKGHKLISLALPSLNKGSTPQRLINWIGTLLKALRFSTDCNQHHSMSTITLCDPALLSNQVNYQSLIESSNNTHLDSYDDYRTVIKSHCQQ